MSSLSHKTANLHMELIYPFTAHISLFTFLIPETFHCAKGDFSCALNTSTQAPSWN